MILTFRPIKVMPEHFKPADAERPPSPFDSSYASTLDLLDRELFQLDAKSAFLQVDATDGQLRLDGQLRSDAVVNHPGVILTIETPRHGALVYPCDRFGRSRPYRNPRPAWQENLRAIALGLEALRKVERYGIAERGQQYAGYRELGAGMAMGPGGSESMSIDEAAELLAAEACKYFGDDWVDADALIAERDLVKGAYRDAVKAHHPDVGGDPVMFRRLTQARDLLTGGAS